MALRADVPKGVLLLERLVQQALRIAFLSAVRGTMVPNPFGQYAHGV